MPPPPKDPDRIPKPRPSRVRSGKPTPPPLETAAGTPEVRARGKGGRKRAEQTTASGMGEAPQADFGVAVTPGDDARGAICARSRRAGPSYDLEETHKPLPALRQQGPLPPMGGAPIGKYLDALLAKPEQRSAGAKELLESQPMLAAHPLVSGNQPIFMPHRPERPEKSEGGTASILQSEYTPKGDQPTAIAELVAGANEQERSQVLLGVTGSGKTFTMAKVIEGTQRPALILAPNKTLAAQLYGEFKSFFPDNAVEYFVSYYDYYQPEAYVPRTDTYIEKESSINEQIDRMRHAATRSLLERDDVIIVASVSCIYGIGSVETYTAMTFTVQVGERLSRDQLIADLVALHYRRNDVAFQRGAFRVRGDTVELFPAHLEDRAWRISLFGDDVESIVEFDPLTGQKSGRPGAGEDLFQLALRDAEADAAAGDQVDQGRAEAAARRAVRQRQAAGGAAAGAAHPLRHGDDGGDGLVRRHRELLALSHRPQAGRAAADAVRIPARQRARVRRREPRDRAADRRACSAATTGARRRWPSTASACPRAWTIVRCASRNGTPCARRRRSSRRRRRHGRSRRPAAPSSSRSSAPPASSIRRCWCARPRRRSTICCSRSGRSPSAAIARW